MDPIRIHWGIFLFIKHSVFHFTIPVSFATLEGLKKEEYWREITAKYRKHGKKITTK
jgi:hypothetical protein